MKRAPISSIVAFAGGTDDVPFDQPLDEFPVTLTGGSADLEDNGFGQSPRPLAVVEGLLAVAGLVTVIISVELPWLRVGAAGSVHLYTGTSLTVIAVAMIALPAAALVALGLCVVRRSRDAQDVATLAAGATAVLAGVLLLFVECASAVIPNGLLPATIRRYTLDLRAGPGLWLALAGSALALAALSGRLVGGFGHPLAGRGLRVSALRLATLAGLGALAVGFGLLRYGEWVHATAAGQSYGIGGWGLPWVGPLSLVAMLGLIAAIAVALTGREGAAGVLAATSGWLITLAAALAIIAADTLGSVGFAAFAPASIRGYTPHLGVGTGAMVSFGIGVAAALIGDVMLWRTNPGPGGG
jgi:hypothetical protein